MLPPASGHNRVGANVIRKICKTFVLVPQKGLFYYSLRKRSTYEESWNNSELSLMPDQYDKNKYIFWRTLITVKKGWNHQREDFKKKRQRKWHCAKRGGRCQKKSNFECIILGIRGAKGASLPRLCFAQLTVNLLIAMSLL